MKNFQDIEREIDKVRKQVATANLKFSIAIIDTIITKEVYQPNAFKEIRRNFTLLQYRYIVFKITSFLKYLSFFVFTFTIFFQKKVL